MQPFDEFFAENCHCGTCVFSRKTLFGLECVSRPEWNDDVAEGWLCGSPYQPVERVAKQIEEYADAEFGSTWAGTAD